MAFRRGPRGLTLLLALGTGACELAPRPGDTSGVQTLARWEWHARLVFERDPRLTLERLRIDTGGRAGGDVMLVRYEFNPTAALGDEYALTLGLAPERLRDLRPYTPYRIGAAPAPIRAYATVTCLCPPLREDSIQGTFQLATRGLRQITGRVDATLYFTEWNDPARHTTYSLHQRVDAIK